jgi:ADP-heptose:LPS heptosyltransferase
MNLATKVLIDRVVGSALISLLLLARPRRRRSSPVEPRTIVVLKLLGLGSIIQATRLLAALRTKYPQAEIVFVTRKGNEELTNRIPGIASTRTIDDASLLSLLVSFLATVRGLRSRPDCCFVNLEAYSRLGVLITACSGARWAAGFYRQASDFNLRRIYDVFVYFNAGAPISEVYLQLGRAFGAGELPASLLELRTSSSDVEEVDTVLKERNVDAGAAMLIAINPNASQLRLERRWPVEKFSELIDSLLDQLPDAIVLLVGSFAERECTASVKSMVHARSAARVIDLAGGLSLGGLVALLRKSALLVTNDSGPMHMAMNVGTPTLALFGPVEPGHYFTQDARAKHAVIYHRVYCSPCVHHFEVAPCRGDNVCMKRITAGEVLSTALSLLRDEPMTRADDTRIVYLERGYALGVLGDQSRS